MGYDVCGRAGVAIGVKVSPIVGVYVAWSYANTPISTLCRWISGEGGTRPPLVSILRDRGGYASACPTGEYCGVEAEVGGWRYDVASKVYDGNAREEDVCGLEATGIE